MRDLSSPYHPCVAKSCWPVLTMVVLRASQRCWAGYGGSRLLAMATMVESGMRVARCEFMVKAKDGEQAT